VSVSINVNGLSLCHKGSGGVVDNTVPDVCKTPDKGIPIPYKNRAFSKDLVKGTTTCFADGGHMVANFGSEFAVSIFDEGGSMGGVVSGTHKAEADWITYSPSVFFEKKPACRLTDKMFMNHRNTVSLAGLTQAELEAFEKFLKIVCPKFCDLVKRRNSGEALKKGETWTRKLHQELAGHADELAKLGVKLEKSAVVAAVKGSAEAWKRKALTKFGKRFGAKLFTKAIPVLGWAMAAYDVYDAASLVKQGYDLMRARPDFVLGDKVGDFKFPGDIWQDGQREAYQALNDGTDPHEVNTKTCKC
jgi:hypothetical protein